MRIPIPTNRLVALTLVGALLTGIVSVGLASPALFPGSNAPNEAPGDGAQLASDVPTPNPDFTPAVQTQSGYEGDEHEEEAYEEYEDDDRDEEAYEAYEDDDREEHDD